MALNEACQLWIEQEIEAGLEEGKTPYAIGQSIAKEVEKLFEAKIPPKTIAKRAERARKKKDPEIETNVASIGRPTKLQQKRDEKAESPATVPAEPGTGETDKDLLTWNDFEQKWRRLRRMIYALKRQGWEGIERHEVLQKLSSLVTIAATGD